MANKNWTKIIILNDRLLNLAYCEDEADLRIISRGNTLRVSDQLDEDATNEEENKIDYSLLYREKTLNEITTMFNKLTKLEYSEYK